MEMIGHHSKDRIIKQRPTTTRIHWNSAWSTNAKHKIDEINKLSGHKPTCWAQIPSCTIHWQEPGGRRINRLQNILVRKLPKDHTCAQFRSILNLPHLNLKLVQIWPAAARVINRHTINHLLSISCFANSTSGDSRKFAPRTSSHHTYNCRMRIWIYCKTGKLHSNRRAGSKSIQQNVQCGEIAAYRSKKSFKRSEEWCQAQ